MRRRNGATLIELMVVVGIVTTVLAILLPAIIQIRAAALRMESMNNLKQLTLAVHTHSINRGGALPDLSYGNGDPRESLFFVLLPYIEHGNFYEDVKAGKVPLSSNNLIKPFISPADPTATPGRAPPLTSYCANAQLFTKGARMPGVFRDGSSNTIMFAEHYGYIRNDKTSTSTMFYWYFQSDPDVISKPGLGTFVVRRATFADEKSGDIIPIPVPGVRESIGSDPNLTFQLRPAVEDADPRIAQTPHASGMLVGMGDGGVRVLRPGMTPTVYWGLVTPAGMEPVSLE